MKPWKESSAHLQLNPTTRGGDDGGSQKNHAEGVVFVDGPAQQGNKTREPGGRRPAKPAPSAPSVTAASRLLLGAAAQPQALCKAGGQHVSTAVAPVGPENPCTARALLKPSSVSSDRQADRQGRGSRGCFRIREEMEASWSPRRRPVCTSVLQ